MLFCGCKFIINNGNEKVVLFEVSFFPFRFGCQRLTLQKGRGCRHRLRNAVHAVDGLEEFWDTIVLICDQHLNL